VSFRRDEVPSPFDVGDPRLKFPHSANAPVLAHLAEDAVYTGAPSGARYDVDDYSVRTHPDLADALDALGRDVGVRRRAAYGVPVLATPGGVVFALARGTHSLGLRLPDREWPLAIEMGAMPWLEVGPDWMQFNAWDADVPSRQHTGDLRYFTASAHRYAIDTGRTT
jgi:hypothetical protein